VTILESNPADFIRIELDSLSRHCCDHTAEFRFQPQGDATSHIDVGARKSAISYARMGNFNEALQVPRFQYNQCARRRVRSAVDGPFVQANRCYRECLRMDKLYMQRSTERLPRQTQQSESSLNIIRRRLETAAKTRAHGSQISNCYRTDPDGLLSGPPVIFPLQIRPDCSSAAAPESLEGQPARRANASWEQERGNNGSLHARRFRTAFANWSQPPAALLVLLFR
jgi:hypothetical protein